jgi:hypothetical protein
MTKLMQLMGWIFLSLVVHEAYHWIYSTPTKACYVTGKGFAVYGTGTAEWPAYILMILVYLLGIYLTFRRKPCAH